MKKITLPIVTILLVLTMVLTVINSVQAAEFFWQPIEQTVGVNQQFTVKLLLGPTENPINALAGKIVWPSDLLQLVKVNQGNSIVPLWITLAQHNSDYEFSGLIPGGFSGLFSPLSADQQPGQILTLVFSAQQVGAGTIRLEGETALLHDGQGTSDQVKSTSLNFIVRAEAVAELNDIPEVIDKKMPEDFTVEMIQSPDLFDGQWVLIFATQDKGSGLDYFAVQEGEQVFSPVTSPYLIQNQELKDSLIVRAVDQAGNIREVVVLTDQASIWYTNPLFYGIIIVTLLLTGILYWLIIKKRYWLLITNKKHGGKKTK